MLHLLEERDRSAALAGFARGLKAAVEAKGQGDVLTVAKVEAEVARDPAAAIRFDADGYATVVGRYRGGRFEVARICELRARALAARARAGRPVAGRTLWVLDGASPATDIGALQASAEPGSLFQAASQFNCLEAPGAYVVPVADYLHDPTQGPRASISAFPGTMVRHYAAPGDDGARFVQESDGRQLDLLADVCDPGVARVRNGYLREADIAQPEAFAQALDERFEAIAVGVHDGVEVVLGADWGGRVEGAPHRTIAQVFTSTVAGGMYGSGSAGVGETGVSAMIVRQLQRAAYLGTLLAAAALGQRRVCLTMIGGGVFANPMRAIWDAIRWASDQVVPFLHRDLTIVVNSRSLGGEVDVRELVRETRARGGGVVRFDRAGATFL